MRSVKALAAATLALPLALAAAGPAAADFAPPVINTGGVVNGVDYSAADIHPGTVISIFGQWFLPPDTVVVTQGPSQWNLAAGTPWWFDSGGQINCTLPTALAPGTATVQVVATNGAQSNVASFTVQP